MPLDTLASFGDAGDHDLPRRQEGRRRLSDHHQPDAAARCLHRAVLGRRRDQAPEAARRAEMTRISAIMAAYNAIRTVGKAIGLARPDVYRLGNRRRR